MAAAKPKQHPVQKFVDRMAKAQGMWVDCAQCQQWHKKELELCPLYFTPREKCEDTSKDGR